MVNGRPRAMSSSRVSRLFPMSSMIRATWPRGAFFAGGAFSAMTTGCGSTGRTKVIAASSLAGRRRDQTTSVFSSPGVRFLLRTRTPFGLEGPLDRGPDRFVELRRDLDLEQGPSFRPLELKDGILGDARGREARGDDVVEGLDRAALDRPVPAWAFSDAGFRPAAFRLIGAGAFGAASEDIGALALLGR